jgi:hypothetical protein
VIGSIYAMNIARENNAGIFIPSTIGAYGGDKFPKDVSGIQESSAVKSTSSMELHAGQLVKLTTSS